MGEIIIRTARDADVQRIYEYGREFYKQTPFAKHYKIKYDEVTVTTMIQLCMHTGCALIVEMDGRMQGLLLAPATPFLMNKDVLAATEWVFYLSPVLRAKGVGKKLIAHAESILRKRGVKIFSMVSLANVHPKAANSLYKQLGFKHSETSFTKEL